MIRWEDAQQRHRKDDDVRRMQLALQESAYFTEGRLLEADPNPFVEKEATNDEVNQLLKNQLVIRSAPFMQRGLYGIGAALIAESIRRANRPPMYVQKTTFDFNSKGFYRTANMGPFQEFGRFRVRKTSWKPQKNKTYARRSPLAKNEAIQFKKFEKRKARAQRTRVAAPRALGTTSIVLGRVVPIMAYSYVGYHLVKGDATSEDVDRLVFGGTFDEYKDMATTIGRELPGKTYFSGVAVKTAATVGISMLTGLLS